MCVCVCYIIYIYIHKLMRIGNFLLSTPILRYCSSVASTPTRIL